MLPNLLLPLYRDAHDARFASLIVLLAKAGSSWHATGTSQADRAILLRPRPPGMQQEQPRNNEHRAPGLGSARFAHINDRMWSELFLLNCDELLAQMDTFLAELGELRELLTAGDEDGIRDKNRTSSQSRAYFDK